MEKREGALEDDDVWGDVADDPMAEFASMTDADLIGKIRELEDIKRVTKTKITHLTEECKQLDFRLAETKEKLDRSTTLPHLVANVGEIIDLIEDPDNREGSGFETSKKDREETSKKALTIKTTSRASMYFPGLGMLEENEIKPGDLIAVNRESYVPYGKLPPEYDSRIKAMEIDERPSEEYQDIGGLDKQIEELVEAIVLPMTHADRFKKLGIRPPKGLLLHGPPGTGKTLMARACAAQTKATFLKLAGPSLVQMFIGDGAKMVRDAFELAKEK